MKTEIILPNNIFPVRVTWDASNVLLVQQGVQLIHLPASETRELSAFLNQLDLGGEAAPL